MNWGDPEVVLSIIAMVMVASIIKAAFRARSGLPMHERLQRLHGPEAKRDGGEIETLRRENSRLTERVEAYEDRIAVLERIVTDSSYSLGREIERLRDDKGKVQ